MLEPPLSMVDCGYVYSFLLFHGLYHVEISYSLQSYLSAPRIFLVQKGALRFFVAASGTVKIVRVYNGLISVFILEQQVIDLMSNLSSP